MIKWKKFSDELPDENSIVVCVDGPHTVPREIYEGNFNRYYTMVMRKGSSLNSLLENQRKSPGYNPLIIASTWWAYAEDFPFPDQPERLSEKTSKDDAIV